MTDAGPLLFSPALARVGVPHGFSTRVGGVSAGAFESLNFGNPGELPPGVARDPKANIEENFRRALAAAGCPGRRILQVLQVHGPDVHIHRPGAAGPPVVWGDVKADALATDDPGVVLAVRIADCCPVLLASADGRAVAAVHAGWRGVVAGVLPRAIGALRALSDARIVAAIGPCISAEHFEVGAEVAAEFHAAFPGRSGRIVLPHPAAGKARIDLKLALALQLEAAGVADHDARPECTVARPDLFFSHRRDRGVSGRMVGLIGPRA